MERVSSWDNVEVIHKINELVNWVNNHEERHRELSPNRPKTLYAIEDKSTGGFIFNARGGAYSDLESAEKKLAILRAESLRTKVGGPYKLVEYKLQEGV